MSVATEPLQKGRYRLDSSAAAGNGKTSVLPAYDTTSDSKVYVKEIVVRLGKVTTLSQQENMRLAFENAAKRMSEFRHDALLQVKDFYSDVGRQYLVLEELDGQDLESFYAANAARQPMEKVLDWADQLLDAVNYLHNQKTLHRGVSPRNVCLTSAEKIKLVGLTIKDDAGNNLSTALSDDGDASLNYSPLEAIWDSLDAASQKVIVNSYDERSEKILKEPADVRSDIYSVAATIYFLLTRRVPVDPLERSIELLEGKNDPLTAPKTIDPSIAPEISDVIMRGLEIKREDRFDSAMIMRQVLRTAIVRAKEREAAEAQEMEEAAELMRSTQQLKMPAAAVPTPPPPAPEPAVVKAQPTEAEILAQKLKEAEELRLEAERKMAEAERLLREQEAERARLEAQARAIHSSAEAVKPTVAEDDLLGISVEPVRTAENAVQHDTGDVDDDIHLSVKPAPRAKIDLREIAKKSEPEEQQIAIEAKPETIVQPEVAHAAVSAPEPVAADDSFLIESSEEANTVIEDTDPPAAFTYAYDEPKRSGLPMPLIAGVAVVVLIAGALGFVFLGGSSTSSSEAQVETPAPTQQQTQTQQQQAAAPVEQAPATNDQQPPQPQQLNTFGETQPAAEARPETPATDARPAAKPAQTPKKAADPAKAPAAKKPVTVEDLINDN